MCAWAAAEAAALVPFWAREGAESSRGDGIGLEGLFNR
jgi:hypothetical protein